MTTESPTLTPGLLAAYDPEVFRAMGHQLVDQLADYLQAAETGSLKTALPHISPDEMLIRWSGEFPENGGGDFTKIITQTLAESNHLHHPGYVGHQVSVPLPMAALCEMVATLQNNGTAVYEMGPVSVAMERHLLRWMAALLGWDTKRADGIFTSGGSAGNLTALLAAQQAKADVWEAGHQNSPPLALLVSEQAHYSIKRAVQMMGWGSDSAIPVKAGAWFKMDMTALADAHQKATAEGKKVIAVVASACTTATGTYDPLDAIANFCEAHDLWMHVDGAHGASVALSEDYRHLLNGIERADSVVWDAHKMMLMPALITAVLFRNGSSSYEAFSQKASYLLGKSAEEEWFNFAHRTLECTKRFMSLKLYTALMVYGTRLFSDHINTTHGLTKTFARMLEEADDFELALEPESNIICFRYLSPNSNEDIDALQARLRESVLQSEQFYLVQTRLPQGLFLRCTLMNPLTTPAHLAQLMDLIRSFKTP